MELRARGWSVRAAAREVGVSRSSGTNWARGHNVYRNGVGVGFVAPLDRLAVRQISPRYLSQDERIEIADLRKSGLSLRAIAARLGRAPSTISRELRRNSVAGRGYRPFDAQRRAVVRRARHHRRRVETNQSLGTMGAELLLRRWSPSLSSFLCKSACLIFNGVGVVLFTDSVRCGLDRPGRVVRVLSSSW